MVNVCSYQRIEYIEIDVVPLRYTQSQLEISMGMMAIVCSYQPIRYIEIAIVPLRSTRSQSDVSKVWQQSRARISRLLKFSQHQVQKEVPNPIPPTPVISMELW